MRRIALISAVFAMLVLVPVALAGESAVLTGYSQPSSAVVKVKAAKTSSQPTKVSANGVSTLPFTGSNLVVVVLAGTALIGLGFGARRFGRNES